MEVLDRVHIGRSLNQIERRVEILKWSRRTRRKHKEELRQILVFTKDISEIIYREGNALMNKANTHQIEIATGDSEKPVEIRCPKCSTVRGILTSGKPGKFCIVCGHKYATEVLLNETE